MINYEQASQLPRSEKITLVTCEAVKFVKIFEQVADYTYAKEIDQVVVKVRFDGLNLEESPSFEELGPTNQWFYDIKQKKLFLYVFEAPSTQNVSLVLRFFFSNSPIILPYDLSSGEEVEWNPIISSIGSIGQQLDDENTGIVLESQSKINFINNTGFFDKIFDSLIWENQEVNFYSYIVGTSKSEIKKIFSGIVESKQYEINSITFNVKDFVYKLRNFTNLELFSELDGNVPDAYIGTPKRRIYGKADKVQCVPIDAVLDGFELTGTVSIALDGTTITGTGTQFLKELSPKDELIIILQGEEYKLNIDTIESDTQATISSPSDFSASNAVAILKPERPYRFKNRYWHLCGHRTRSSFANITNIINARTYVVNDVSEFFPDDYVTINGQTTQITRVSGDQLILEQNLGVIPGIGDKIERQSVTGAYFGERSLVLNRDYSVIQTNDNTIIQIEEKAEFNISKEISSDFILAFSNNDRYVSLPSGYIADLRTIVSPNDWIRRKNDNTLTWYEVLNVTQDTITLRTPYVGPSLTDRFVFKNVNTISDNSLILIDTYGKDSGEGDLTGTWIKTASDVVKDLVVRDSGFTSINQETFDQANSDCDYLISMVIPESIGDETPLVRDVITKINDSVFGSLYGNSSQELCYSIVNTRRPPDALPIKDDDIISWNVSTSQNIISNVVINYSPFVDNITGENSFRTIEYSSDFVEQNIKIKNTKEKMCYLYFYRDAEVIAQRTAFYNSLSQSILTLKAKANFFSSSVNDRCYIELDRLYSRFGGVSNRKIGVVSGVRKNAYESEIIMNDLGNIFNRCPSIGPNNLVSFTESSEDEKIKFGYIVDNNTLTPDVNSEEEIGSNLIG